jgi:hypothetical protein
MFPSDFEVKRSSALDIKVEIWFSGSGILFFPLGDTISHIWTTHGRKVFPIEFGVPKVKCTGY